MARRQLEVSNEVAAELAGAQDRILRRLEEELRCEIFLRGNVVTLDGDAEAVANGATVVRELSALVERGHEIAEATVETVGRVLDAAHSPATVLEDVVWRHRNLRVAPKSVNQKRYVDAIRGHTVTFGIGPAGTGKTFLAIAMAVSALSRREVNRIILTRPAVEAGERLGFLPGDLMAKVDPYLRPLFDAMNDMLDPERVTAHLEKGVIEVAPLAFMRGRAQPVDTPVLTPGGWRPIGQLRVGDLVVGSDGLPTPVLGVFPQGRKAVFRVRTEDGASTLACAEHLWQVSTAAGGHRVVTTADLAADPGARFELPVVAPVQFPARDVPEDPYEFGRARFLDRVPGQGTTRTLERVGIGDYLLNTTEVRRAVLQGLLDGGADPASGAVAFLVGSLGGIVERDGTIRMPGRSRPRRFVVAVEPAGDAECVCISVGAQDSLYVTEDFLVTHNTLNDSFVILDEAQNTSPEQMKMFLTRLGFGSKMVVNGDVSQIDLPRDQRSGLVEVTDILDRVEGIEVVRFGNEDVVRHKLVQRIVQAYAEHAERAAPELRPAKQRRP